MIFFDIDGTLVDHVRAEYDAVIAFQREHAASFPEPAETFVHRWHVVAEKHMQRYLAGETSFQEQRRSRVKEMFAHVGPPLTDGHADHLFISYLKYYESNWRLFPEVLECLRTLSSQRLGIISNGDAQQQRQKLEYLDIASSFTTVTISSELGVAKPQPGIFREACRQAHVSPATSVYVGDQLETDAQAALHAGLHGIWLNRNGLPRANAGVPVIASLSELQGLIASHNKALQGDARSSRA